MGRRPRGRPRGNERITYRQAADLFGVGTSTIAAWVKDGYLDAYETPGGRHQLWRTVCLELLADRNK